MDTDWVLIEFRPGRFAKVTPDGTVIGLASEAEAKAWFAARGWEPGATPDVDLPPLSLSLGIPRPDLPSADEILPSPPTWMTRRSRDVAPAASQVETEVMPQSVEKNLPEPTPDMPDKVDDALSGETRPERPEAAPPVSAREDPDSGPSRHHRPPPAPRPRRVESDPLREAGPALPSGLTELEVDLEPEELDSGAPVQDVEFEEWEDVALDSELLPGREDDLFLDEDVEWPPVPGKDHHLAASELPPTSDGTGWWLWVDPRQEPGYSPVTFDLASFLQRASRLFQSKAWSGGHPPARLAAHPDQVAFGLQEAADELGLEIVTDPQVTPGTYRLGLEQRKRDG